MIVKLDWFKQNSQQFSGVLCFDEPLSKHTYYRIGGVASICATPSSVSDLHWLAQGIHATGVPVFILGRGTNVLVADEGFQGLVIKINRLNLTIENKAASRICTGASVAISSLLRKAAHEGWKGLEFLTGVPGSVGGAIAMNAGTYLGEAVSRVKRVEVYSLSDDELKVFEGDRLQFQYRSNLFLKPDDVIYQADWEIEKAEPAIVKDLIDSILTRRKTTQPIEFPSCGSVFKNPSSSELSSWQVIDRLGLRGFQIGDAQFSEKHCNFIINLGHATATDVRALIQLAKERARKELGISLEEEVKYLGFTLE